MTQDFDRITLIKSTNPAKVHKQFKLEDDGSLSKSAVANIVEGVAVTYSVPDADSFASLLKKVTERDDVVVCPGIWDHAVVGEKFDIYSEKQLSMMLGYGSEAGNVPGGVLTNDQGQKVAGRLRRGIQHASWVLLDADNPTGMPDDWAKLTIAQRLKLWDVIVPGISGVERIELCSSSARVSNDGQYGHASHAWIRVSHPENVELLQQYLRVHMVLKGLSFAFLKHSQSDGKVVATEDRGLFDLSVMIPGRLVFCSKPDVSQAPGYSVSDADVRIVNAGRGPLQIGHIDLPTEDDLKAFHEVTQIDLGYSREGNKLKKVVRGLLTLDTEVDVRGTVLPLRDWVEGKPADFRLRCETPFRPESRSEAAFIRVGENGLPFLHDVGSSTTYTLMPAATAVAMDFENLDEPVAANDASIAQAPAAPVTPQVVVRQNIRHGITQPRSFDFREWAYLKARNVFRNTVTGEEAKKDAFNTAFHRYVPITQVNGRSVQPQPSVYLLRDQQGQIAHDTLYWPKATVGGKRFFSFAGVRYLNSYMPELVPQSDPNWQSHPAWQTVLAHFKQILPDDWNMLLQWLAHNVQKPGEKILWALVIKGVEGDGKTTIYKLLGHVMGSLNVREVSTQELNSEFNAWAEGSCVVALEEVRIKGHNRYDTMNKLKPVVTNTTISVVRKGQDGRNVPNCTNYIAFTNETDALALTENDRRYGVLFTKYQTREELEAETDKAYWDRLHDAYQQHPEVIRGWLESIDLSTFDSNAAPKMTEAKRQMIRNSKSEDFLVVEEAIHLGGFGISPAVIATDCLNEAIRSQGHFKVRTNSLKKVMEELGYDKYEPTMKWQGKVRRLYYKRGLINPATPTEQANATFRGHLDASNDLFMEDVG
jgi:hypothetical protein